MNKKIKSAITFFKSKKNDASGSIIKFGSRGCGKSTDIAKAFFRFENSKNSNYSHFYSNLYINSESSNFHFLDLNTFNFTDYIDPNLSSNYSGYYTVANTPFKIQRNSVIYLDELGLLYSNRSWKSFPKEFTKFCRLLRHFNILLVMYSQSYDIDKSLRTSANELYLMTKLGHLTINRRIKKYIGVTDKDDEHNADSQICDKVELCTLLEPHALSFTYIPFYTYLFDSFD